VTRLARLFARPERSHRLRRPRRLPRSLPKFALFAAACLLLLGALAVKLGNISLSGSRSGYQAQLNDVTGLTTGEAVDVAGVPVGQVTAIALRRGHAVVTLDVNSTVTLRSGTDVGLRWKNVIGQKVLYLYPSRTGNMLAPGATIPLSHDVSDASVDALLNSLGPFLQSINPQEANTFVENVSGALEKDTAEVDQLIDNGATVARTVGNLNAEVGTVIDSLDRVLTAIASRGGDLTTLVSNLQSVAQSLATHNSVLEDVVNNLSSVSSDLANLVTSNRSNLDGSIADLNAVTATLAQNQQELAHGLSTLGEGLAPYTEISSWGQWFQIQTVYTCLANETTCTYYEPTNAPSGSGVAGGLPSGTTSTPAPSVSAPSSTPSRFGPLAQSSIPQILGAVGGSAPPATKASAT